MKKQRAPAQDLKLEKVLHALGDSVRLAVVRQLAREGETSCAALDAGRPKSTMSHHFKVLREAGLVETRTCGVTHLNTLRRMSIDAAFPGLLDAIISVGNGEITGNDARGDCAENCSARHKA